MMEAAINGSMGGVNGNVYFVYGDYIKPDNDLCGSC